ncbi:4a-hydroxytetrahydrobiopterin dehydratase [Spongisporangium articulatum]|uniref:Putative pterin-4-alpha-carbinolamine dehydratase n=1 Tax=Spongisporangium articulatum TaxID=3362603 RepID=A0ABW8AQ98_9ACTN
MPDQTPERLNGEQVTAALTGLPGVHRGGVDEIRLQVEAPSFPAALELVAAVGATAERLNHHPDIDIRWRTVTFTLATHSAGGVTTLDLDLARRIVDAAGAAGATVVPPPGRVEIALDVVEQAAVQEFWRVGLGYVVAELTDGDVELHHPSGQGPVLWFQTMDPPRTERGRFHLDVHVTADEAPGRVAAVVAAGGRLVTDEFAPRWWVLADPEGNELCVCVP